MALLWHEEFEIRDVFGNLIVLILGTVIFFLLGPVRGSVT